MNSINGNFSKKDEMSLLYVQSLEIMTLYHQPIPKNTYNPTKYYLLPKNWVDGYKYQNNYNEIKQQISDNTDYNSLKSKIAQENSLSKNNGPSQNNQIKQIPLLEKNNITIDNNDIKYPVNFYPIKEEILKNSLNDNNDIIYELIIGENNIFVIDNKSKKNIFICSIYSEEEDIDNFIVNVDYIIKYNTDKNFEKEMTKYMSDNKGFQNYCKKRNLLPKLNVMQDIINYEEEKIGKFITINDKTDETPIGMLLNYVPDQNIIINNENIIRNNNGNNMDNNNDVNNGSNMSNNLGNNKDIKVIKLSDVGSNINFGRLSLNYQSYGQNAIQNFNNNNNINNNNGNFNNNNMNNNMNNNNQPNYNQNQINKTGGKYIITISGEIYCNVRKRISISIMENENKNNNNNAFNNYNNQVNNNQYQYNINNNIPPNNNNINFNNNNVMGNNNNYNNNNNFNHNNNFNNNNNYNNNNYNNNNNPQNIQGNNNNNYNNNNNPQNIQGNNNMNFNNMAGQNEQNYYMNNNNNNFNNYNNNGNFANHIQIEQSVNSQ